MYYSLQIARALAALGVVLTHIAGPMSVEKYFGYSVVENYLSFGTHGVEFFFVLSGFIIYNVHKEHISKPSFLIEYIKKRFIRIYPIYFIIFLFIYLLAIITKQESVLNLDYLSIIKALFLFSDFPVPILGVAWTLEYEIFFYAIFALLIIHRYFIFIIVCIFLYYNFYNISNEDTFIYINFMRSQIIYLFLFGIIVAYLLKYKIKHNQIIYLFILGFIIIVINIFDTIIQLNIFNSIRSLFLGLGFALIIYSVVKFEISGMNFKKYKIMNLIGDASYSLYLIHVPVISIVAKISMIIGLKNLGILGAIISFIIMLIISIIFAIMINIWIEKPLIRKLSHKRKI